MAFDTGTMAAQKSQSPAMEFLVDSLKRNPKAAYSDLKAKADEKKLKVFPIMFGRAQAMLGIVKMAKRGQGKAAKAKAAKSGGAPARRGRQNDPSSKSGKVRELLAAGMSPMDIAKKVGCTPGLVYIIKGKMKAGGGAAKRGPGRPRKVAAASSSLVGISGILDAVRNAERERTSLRAVLERLQIVIADALG